MRTVSEYVPSRAVLIAGRTQPLDVVPKQTGMTNEGKYERQDKEQI